MSECKLSRRVVINNRNGLHMRPGELFVRQAVQFESKIEIMNGAQRVDGKSLLEILTLGAEKGTELEIEASGPDAEAALDALTEFLEQESIDDETTDQP